MIILIQTGWFSFIYLILCDIFFYSICIRYHNDFAPMLFLTSFSTGCRQITLLLTTGDMRFGANYKYAYRSKYKGGNHFSIISGTRVTVSSRVNWIFSSLKI